MVILTALVARELVVHDDWLGGFKPLLFSWSYFLLKLQGELTLLMFFTFLTKKRAWRKNHFH